MKEKLVMLLVACCAVLPMGAQQQDRKPQRLTPEEFRAKHEAFITEKAKLTPQEAAKFFPLYFELQEKKKELNKEPHQLFPQGKKGELSEEECEKILRAVADSKIETAQLEKKYLDKFKEILTYKKILQVQRAETYFYRELLKNVNHRHGEKMKGGEKPFPLRDK